MTLFLRWLTICSLGLLPLSPASAEPLRIIIKEGVIAQVPLALPIFIAETPEAQPYAEEISRVVASDLIGTGFFSQVAPEAFISQVTSFDAPVSYPDWQAINAQGLVIGAVAVSGDGKLIVKFHLYDVFSSTEMGEGLQFAGNASSTRRIGHKVADEIYSRITGEGGYFDSRVVFVSESGPKDNRAKRLAVMDYDGANVQYLTDSSTIVFGPRFSPDGSRILYTSYASGEPQIMLMDVASRASQTLLANTEGMSVAPSFSPDGTRAVFSLASGGNSDLYVLDLGSGQITQLTNAPSIETSPSFSPDGSQIVFESDRSGGQQIYMMSAGGGEAVRISGGAGRYGTPVWSPKGDYIAFTKQNEGRFHIGAMRADGSEERLLTASFLDEGPTWAPNGRVIMFTRESEGASGGTSIYSIDITGRNIKRLPTETMASDPTWSPLLR